VNVRYHVDGHLSATVRDVVERELKFLDARLANFEDDLKSLDVTVRYRARDEMYVAKLVLRLPSRTIAVTGSGPWRPAAIRVAFDSLRIRLDEHLAKLRGEPAWRGGRQAAHDVVGSATADAGALD
jgi:hypothetical protein